MIRSVNCNEKCPICGKTDWCGIMSTEDGEAYVCQRNTDSLSPYKDGVIGMDGQYYICIGVSKEGQNNIFMDAMLVQKKSQLKKEEWLAYKQANNIGSKPLTPVNILDPASNDRLDKVYRTFLSLLILEHDHKDKLLSEGWSDELIEMNVIRSLPEEDYTRFMKKDVPGSSYYSKNAWRKKVASIVAATHGDLSGIPGFYKTNKGEWNIYGQHGMIFPLYDCKGKIYRLRIRLDEIPQNGGKYRNFSSFIKDKDAEQQGFYMNKLDSGTQAGNNLGFYINSSRDDMYIAYVTEGEKKGIFGEWKLRAPVISVPGVNSYAKLLLGPVGKRPVDELKNLGIKIIIIAFDADKHVNEKVMKSQQDTVSLLRDEGFIIGLAEWDPVKGKGLDDLLAAGGKPTYVLA